MKWSPDGELVGIASDKNAGWDQGKVYVIDFRSDGVIYTEVTEFEGNTIIFWKCVLMK